MITLFLQCVVALLSVAFGALALAVARQAPLLPVHRWTWRLTGRAHLALGVAAVIHATLAVWAYFSGPGTDVYTTFLRWSPAGNHLRQFMAMAVALSLGAGLLLRMEPRRALRVGTAALVGGAALGAVLGGWEGPLVPMRHFSLLSVTESLQMLTLVAALIAGVVTNGLERHLWLALSVYFLRLVLNILFLSAYAWTDVTGAWSPPAWLMPLVGVLADGIMIALAARALGLARRGRALVGVLGGESSRPHSFMGWR